MYYMNINKSRKYIRFSISFQFRNLEKNALYFMFIYFNYVIRKENYFQIFLYLTEMVNDFDFYNGS